MRVSLPAVAMMRSMLFKMSVPCAEVVVAATLPMAVVMLALLRLTAMGLVTAL